MGAPSGALIDTAPPVTRPFPSRPPPRVPLVSQILFADDNADMRSMVRTIMEAAGHDVRLASDGVDALEAVAQKEPDLLILDLEMPRMSGFEVCRTIKANPVTARIPVLMLTGMGAVEYKVEGFEAGADDYLAKPFDPRELRARVAALLRLVQREGDRNPTSGLPGGRAIEAAVAARVASGVPFAIAYADIDNFKAFADRFGFSTADQVIEETGWGLLQALKDSGEPGDFLGHIGGDDFILLSRPERADAIARACATRFREAVGRVIGAEALAADTFMGEDRDGQSREIPLARLSVAILVVEPGRWTSLARFGERAAELKREAKRRGAGTIITAQV
jgi:PleD family two-component response regulator